ncbi:hypothetical protein [Cohnella yongneupensis]|uniref:YhfM-like domain-containing protein n=1 Tax=Cohnella yongneupensis TaxID=425006 RepID=A0ABW0QZ82_9BACL
MGTIQRKSLLIILFLFVFEIIGCGNNILDGKEIVEVKLECAELCKTMKTPPFSTKIVAHEQADEIRAFERAIGKATKINGELDYGAMFFMYLTFEDDAQKKYVLNVADEEGTTALLVDTANSGQGYTIPKEQTNELRKIIYNN